jgi:hypothetical protein
LGILSFHDFELHENGDVTAWKSTGIGPGKRFTKAELDKKYVQKYEQSRELQALQQEMQVTEQGLRFPQGSTGATFTTVLAEETFVPKFELCKTRKRERDAERDQKTAGRKKRSIDEKEAQQAKLQAVKDERASHKCHACGTGYTLQAHLEAHVCTPILADAKNNVNDEGNKTEPFKKPATILLQECNTPVPLMGHGLVMHRNQNYLTSAVRNLLEVEYQKGVANSGSRKGVLEMVETCCKTLPALMVPSILAVSSWLAGRLQRNPAARESASSEERTNRNQFLKCGNRKLHS